VDRLTRKELKTDEVAEKAFEFLDWTKVHQAVVIRGVIAVVVLGVAWLGYHFYNGHQAEVRQEALAKALRVQEATTGTNIQPASAHFDTEDEKTKAAAAAMTDVAKRFSGTQEGAIAQMYLAGAAAEKGDLPGSEKLFKEVVADAPASYASLARLSLANVYASEGKNNDAETVLRDAMAHPTSTVSRESAALALAQILAKTKPEEARKLVDPLRTMIKRPAVSREAITVATEFPAATK